MHVFMQVCVYAFVCKCTCVSSECDWVNTTLRDTQKPIGAFCPADKSSSLRQMFSWDNPFKGEPMVHDCPLRQLKWLLTSTKAVFRIYYNKFTSNYQLPNWIQSLITVFSC